MACTHLSITREIRSVLDVEAEVKDVCTELTTLIKKDTSPEMTYNEIVKTIGEQSAKNFRDDFKYQVVTMLKQVTFHKKEQFHKVYWQNGKLIIMSIELGIRCNQKSNDEIMFDMISCYAEADFNKEWLWRKWKSNRCEDLVVKTFQALKVANQRRIDG